MLHGIELLVQLVQKPGHSDQVPGIGQLPQTAAEEELVVVGRRHALDEGVVQLGNPRHLNDIERLHTIVLEVMLQPLTEVHLDKNGRLLIAVIDQKLPGQGRQFCRHSMFVRFLPQGIDDGIAGVFLLVVPVNNPWRIRPREIQDSDKAKCQHGPIGPNSR